MTDPGLLPEEIDPGAAFPVRTYCGACSKRHVDEGEWRHQPHRTHRCVDDSRGPGCGAEWIAGGLPTVGVAWEPRLSYAEALLGMRSLCLTAEDLRAVFAAPPRRALIVGEAPGERTRTDCPLFPWPRESGGGRLLAISGMTPRDFLIAFDRVDLLAAWPGREWNRDAAYRAEVAAAYHLEQAAATGQRLVLCGRRVQRAFGEPIASAPTHRWHVVRGASVAAIPHPSGRSPVYNKASERALAARTLREAREKEWTAQAAPA